MPDGTNDPQRPDQQVVPGSLLRAQGIARRETSELEAPRLGLLAGYKARHEVANFHLGLLRIMHDREIAGQALAGISAVSIDLVANVADVNRAFEAIYVANQDSLLATSRTEAIIPLAQQIQEVNSMRILESAAEQMRDEVRRRR